MTQIIILLFANVCIYTKLHKKTAQTYFYIFFFHIVYILCVHFLTYNEVNEQYYVQFILYNKENRFQTYITYLYILGLYIHI